MCDDSPEDLWFIGLCAQFSVQILKFNFFATEVVIEAAKLRSSILFSAFIVESI
jgi:hypothetical protein